ncbi:MAG: twin-arginine translocase subunit TatC [Candidatus Altiarchaeales archaeon]|nr:MAG: twin-arginine translocase subunit TatC [Candidatus Altiarchaeales archaeon]
MKLTLEEHLQELRRRILWILFILVFFSIVSYPLTPSLLSKIKRDLLRGSSLVVLSPQEAILVYIKISLLLGFTLSLPFIIFHSWRFIAPGLIEREKRLFLCIVTSSILLFLLGAGFAYFFLLPITLRFLLEVANWTAVPMLSLDRTINFILLIILISGLIFQLPLVVGILTRLSLVNYKILSSKRRYVILLAFIISALITDPSMVTQILVAIPIIILYEISIMVSKILGK